MYQTIFRTVIVGIISYVVFAWLHPTMDVNVIIAELYNPIAMLFVFIFQTIPLTIFEQFYSLQQYFAGRSIDQPLFVGFVMLAGMLLSIALAFIIPIVYSVIAIALVWRLCITPIFPNLALFLWDSIGGAPTVGHEYSLLGLASDSDVYQAEMIARAIALKQK